MVNRFNRIKDQAETSLKEKKGWYENLKEKIQNLFFRKDPKFELDKKALNTIKRYVLDLKTKQKLSIIRLMEKTDIKSGEIETKEANFNSKHNENIFEGSHFDEIYKQMCDEIILQFEEFIDNGSMWNFSKGLKIVLNIYKYNPLKASSWIPLPQEIKLKKAVVNPKNNSCGVLEFINF